MIAYWFGEAEKQHWICDEHKGSPHKKCKLCNRWQAIESGKVKKPEKYKTAELDEKGWERLYEAGTKGGPQKGPGGGRASRARAAAVGPEGARRRA